MRIPKFAPTGVLAPLRDWVTSVQSVLSNGWTVRDNAAGEVKVIRWDADTGVAVDASTSLRARPLSVLGLAAVRAAPGTAGVVSGLVVSWEWIGDGRGTVRVTAVPSLGGSVWDVTLWIVGG